MSKESIQSIFFEECAHLEIDAKLIQRILKYQLGFVNKNKEHIEFFGGHLTGVHKVRFSEQDRLYWFDTIIEVDEEILRERLYSLESINPDFHVSSDVMNLSCAWLTHAISKSTNLSETQKKQGMKSVLLVLQYKFLTSRIYHHFPFPADPAIAEATYAALSNKFSLKKYGSWAAFLDERCDDILRDNGLHRDAIRRMDDDKEVVDMLNDLQGRIRDTIKNIYGVHLQVKDAGDRIYTTSSVVEHDGVEILKDRSKSTLAYGRYINQIISDRNSFIRQELVVIIHKIMHTMPERLFEQTLEWMSANYRQRGADEIEQVLNEVIVHSFDYLSDHRSIMRNSHDLAGMLSKLRGAYTSSRSTDVSLISLREKTEKIVRLATGNKNNSIIASVRTGVLLYVVLRTYTMNYYASGGVEL